LRLYLDTSALVKLYVEERGTDQVVGALAEAERVYVSVIVYAEACAAFARRRRARDLTVVDEQAAQGQFRADWPSLDRIPADEALAIQAGVLASTHGLRGYDAVHLASALHVQRVMGGEPPVLLATFDRELAVAATREGLRLL